MSQVRLFKMRSSSLTWKYQPQLNLRSIINVQGDVVQDLNACLLILTLKIREQMLDLGLALAVTTAVVHWHSFLGVPELPGVTTSQGVRQH